MKRVLSLVTPLAALMLSAAMMVGCNPEPTAPELSISYSTYTYTEGSVGHISLYQLFTPEKYPVRVDMKVSITSGKDAEGNPYTLADVLEFTVDDNTTYTVTANDDGSATISGIEVTYSEYNTQVPFQVKENDTLQQETITITFEITNIDGSELGSYGKTVVTIEDNEHAPRIKSAYYKTDYTPVAEAESPEKGSFYLQLHKTDKYEYVAEGWFGLPRPRLVGIFDPEAKTLTFDGTDYDHRALTEKERVNAFQNDTLWWANTEMTKVLRLYGSGAAGTNPIVISTEDIKQDQSGLLVNITTKCGVGIYTFKDGKAKTRVGTWDGMEGSTSMTYSETPYDEGDFELAARKRSYAPMPFTQWSIAPIAE